MLEVLADSKNDHQSSAHKPASQFEQLIGVAENAPSGAIKAAKAKKAAAWESKLIGRRIVFGSETKGSDTEDDQTFAYKDLPKPFRAALLVTISSIGESKSSNMY